MTEAFPAAPLPVDAEQLVEQLVEQVRAAATAFLVACVDDPSPAQTPTQQAFLRLLAGRGSAADGDAMGVPVAGSRLVVVRHREAAVVAAAAATLSRDRDLLVAVHDDAAVGLARNVPRRAGEDKGLRTAARVATLVARQHPGVRVGISSQLAAPDDLPAARRDATDAADLADGPGPAGESWRCVDDLWAELVVARLRQAVAGCLTSAHPLTRLAAYDRGHDGALASTVATWLQRQGDTIRTAEQLSLHPNTLRYRLRRAQEVSGLDLTDPAQTLVAQLLLEPRGNA
ncbi:MAG TPA: helix-turn-helix domain-containing protein [Mycobacteriales bacterium]|nr:helix-turn-helix domain-containing protein [Mycobacteriales bacterium]